jgi:hypothetical protein
MFSIQKFFIFITAALFVILPVGVDAQTLPSGLTLEEFQSLVEESGIDSPITSLEDLDSLTPEDIAALSLPEEFGQEGLVNCFDRYNFGSVQVQVDATLSSVIPGGTVTFVGNIINENEYPVVDASVYVKIFKTDEGNISSNAFDVVDQFFVKENVALAANEHQSVNFSWDVPRFARAGEYQVATFVVADKKWNLLGLPFTDDVVGNTADFRVNTKKTTGVYFDKDSVEINGEDYRFAKFPPEFENDEEIVLTANLVNTTNTDHLVSLSWKLHEWDGLEEENIVDKETESIRVPARSGTEVSFTTTMNDYPVYYLVGEILHGDAKSLIGPRFVRKGTHIGRLNFPALTSFPLEKGEEVDLFSCMHVAGDENIENSTIVLTVTTPDGEPIHSFEWRGTLTPRMMGVVSTFTPADDYDYVLLQAELYDRNNLTDTSVLEYDCVEIDSLLCTPAGGLGDGVGDIILTIFLLLLIVAIAMLVHKYLESKNLKRSLLTLLVIFLGVTLFGQGVEAKSVVWGDVASSFTKDSPSAGGVNWLYFDTITSLQYSATLYDLSTGASINDGSTLSVGDTFELHIKDHEREDVSWFISGGYVACPYGDFVEEWSDNPASGGLPSEERGSVASIVSEFFDFDETLLLDCENRASEDILSIPYGVPGLDGTYDMAVVVKEPGLGIQGEGPIECVPVDEGLYGWNRLSCTVTGEGDIDVSVNFGNTYAQYRMRLSGMSTLSGFAAYQGIIPTMGDFFPINTTIFDWAFGSPSSYSDTLLRNRLSEEGYDIDDYCIYPETSGHVVEVPPQSVNLSFSAVSGNNPPLAPTITGPGTLAEGDEISLDIISTDEDGDDIRYGVDWDSDGNIDDWTPGVDYVSSGTSQSSSFTPGVGEFTAGEHTITVFAQDDKSAISPSSTHTITIEELPEPELIFLITDDEDEDGDGTNYTANSTVTVGVGHVPTFAWQTLNASQCIADSSEGDFVGDKNPLGGTAVGLVTRADETPRTYSVDCLGTDGVTYVGKEITLVIETPEDPDPTPALTAACTVLTDPVVVRQEAVFTATPNSTECPTCTYTWSNSSETSDTLTRRYPTIGDKTITLSITDGGITEVGSCAFKVQSRSFNPSEF